MGPQIFLILLVFLLCSEAKNDNACQDPSQVTYDIEWMSNIEFIMGHGLNEGHITNYIIGDGKQSYTAHLHIFINILPSDFVALYLSSMYIDKWLSHLSIYMENKFIHGYNRI